MTERCERAEQVEALLDGRLEEDATRNLEAHVRACEACRTWLSVVEQMRISLRQNPSPPNAFVMKRLRREVIEQVQAGPPVRRLRPRVARLALAFAALTMALAAVAGVALWWQSPRGADVTVMAGPGARFSREEDASKEIVRLTDGTFDFDVHAHADGRRLLVVVPDGEIEDIGTRFRVVVQGGVTQEISVSAGEVELRRPGSAPLRLIAGMSYRPITAETAQRLADAQASAMQAVVGAPAVAAPPAAAPVADRANAHQSGNAAQQPKPRTGAEAAPTRHQPMKVAAVKAAAATAAPRNPQPEAAPAASTETGQLAEDVAYLRVVRLLRANKSDEARRAAGEYLSQFPAGLRRIEMQKIREAAPAK